MFGTVTFRIRRGTICTKNKDVEGGMRRKGVLEPNWDVYCRMHKEQCSEGEGYKCREFLCSKNIGLVCRSAVGLCLLYRSQKHSRGLRIRHKIEKTKKKKRTFVLILLISN